jgi:hypothetical protein
VGPKTSLGVLAQVKFSFIAHRVVRVHIGIFKLYREMLCSYTLKVVIFFVLCGLSSP